MRAAGLCVLLVCVVAGCKGKGEADAAPDPAAVKAQQDLIARREALLALRNKLQDEKDAVETQIKRNPLTAVLIALGFGVSIGLLSRK